MANQRSDTRYPSNPPPVIRSKGTEKISDLGQWKISPESQNSSKSPLDTIFLNKMLIRAVVLRQNKVAVFSIEQGAEVNTRDSQGCTPLMLAAASGNTELVRNLIDANAELDAGDYFGKTALHKAAFFSHKDIVRILLEKGLKPDIRDTFGWTALMTSVFFGDIDTALILLSYGADIRSVNCEGFTVLEIAQGRNREYMLDLLESYLSK